MKSELKEKERRREMRKNWGRYLRRGIGILLIGLTLNLPSAEKEIQKQQYQPRVFEQPILIESHLRMRFVSLAIDKNDNLGIAYPIPTNLQEYSYNLRFAKFSVDNLDIQTIVSSGSSVCSLAFNPLTNQPAIAKGPNFHFFDGSNWLIQKIPYVSAQSLSFHPINNYPCIAANSAGGDWNLIFLKYDGSTWQTRIISWNDADQESMKFNSNNEACIAYHSWYYPQSTILYCKVDPENFQTTGSFTIDTSAGPVSLDLFPLMGPNYDYPAVSYSYYDNATKKFLVKYAQWDGSQWQKEVVDNNLKYNTSLTFDSLGHPIISYICNNGDIKIAEKIEGQWQIQTVTNNPYITEDYYPQVCTSSVINSQNKIVIAYSITFFEGRNGGIWLIAEQGALPPPTAVPQKIWQQYK